MICVSGRGAGFATQFGILPSCPSEAVMGNGSTRLATHRIQTSGRPGQLVRTARRISSVCLPAGISRISRRVPWYSIDGATWDRGLRPAVSSKPNLKNADVSLLGTLAVECPVMKRSTTHDCAGFCMSRPWQPPVPLQTSPLPVQPAG